MPSEQKKKILFIDDEPLYAKNYTFALEHFLDIEFDLYSTVESAIYLLQTNYYDLIITDLMMRVEIPLEATFKDRFYGGAFLIKKIRSGVWDSKDNNFALSKTPIILLSNACHEIDFEQIERLMVFEKNLRPSQLTEIVRSILFEEKSSVE